MCRLTQRAAATAACEPQHPEPWAPVFKLVDPSSILVHPYYSPRSDQLLKRLASGRVVPKRGPRGRHLVVHDPHDALKGIRWLSCLRLCKRGRTEIIEHPQAARRVLSIVLEAMQLAAKRRRAGECAGVEGQGGARNLAIVLADETLDLCVKLLLAEPPAGLCSLELEDFCGSRGARGRRRGTGMHADPPGGAPCRVSKGRVRAGMASAARQGAGPCCAGRGHGRNRARRRAPVPALHPPVASPPLPSCSVLSTLPMPTLNFKNLGQNMPRRPTCGYSQNGVSAQ